VGDVENGDVYLSDVGVDRDVIFSEVFVDGAAEDRVNVSLFVQCERNSPDDASDQLVETRLVVHQSAEVVSADHSANLDHTSVPVHSDFGEDSPKGVSGVRGPVCSGLRTFNGFDGLASVASNDLSEGLSGGGM